MTSGYAIPASLHTLGLVLLWRAKSALRNQKILTMNLAAAESIYCVVSVANLLGSHTFDSVFLTFSLFNALFFAIRFAIFLIIIDRFLYVWLNIKYFNFMKKKTLKVAIFLQWLLSICLSALFLTLIKLDCIDTKSVRHLSNIAYLTIDIAIIITAAFTCSYFFVTVRIAIHKDNNQQRGKRNWIKLWYKLKVPFLIVITFIIFNASSTVLAFIYYINNVDYSNYPKLLVAHLTLDILGCNADVLIYIILQKSVRCLLVSAFGGARRNEVDTMIMRHI